MKIDDVFHGFHRENEAECDEDQGEGETMRALAHFYFCFHFVFFRRTPLSVLYYFALLGFFPTHAQKSGLFRLKLRCAAR